MESRISRYIWSHTRKQQLWILAIVAAGEQSGKLGHGLERAAQDLEQELDSLVQALVSLVEPGVLLVMGGIVLLMVLAILMPIVNLNNLAGL